MANTRETVGDQQTVDGLVSNTLTSLEEDAVTMARTYALYGKTQLTDVKFANMKYISNQMCQNDTGLTQIASTDFPNAIRVEQSAFQGCTGLTSVNMPNVTTLSTSAFQGCTGIQHITDSQMPKVEFIGSSVFSGCTGLVDAEFPAVTTIASYAFNGCSNLEKVETGTATTSFNSPFDSCAKLDALIINSTAMSSLSGNLSGTKIASYQGAVYVPENLVDIYKANSVWKTYFILPISSYPVSDYGALYDSQFSSITDSWAEIIANEDYATDYHVGDTKVIDLGSSFGKSVMELIAIDADDRADGDITINNGKARMTWLMKDCFATHKMNDSSTNANGWLSTVMRSWLRDTVLPNFPEVVRNNIVEVSKTYYDYTTKTTKTSSDTIWIPSYREMFGGTSYENDGVDYTSKFNANNARVKNYNGSAKYWWLRSASSNSSSTFVCIYSYGSSTDYSATYSNGVVAGFCL